MKTSKKIIAVIMTLCMMIPVISLIPHPSVVAASTESESSPISTETYSELGFNTMSEDEYPTNEVLNRRYAVTNVQNELYVHVNADEHYGTTLRDNLRFFSSDRDARKSKGAIKTYGDKAATLGNNNGNSHSYLDEMVHQAPLYSSFSQGSGKTESKAYATSVALRSLTGAGTDDTIATLEVQTTSFSKVRRFFDIGLTLETFSRGTRVKTGSKKLATKINPSSMSNIAGSGVTLDFQNLEYDALIEITAGDYNGDGKDEIAVYYGTGKIFIYKIDSSLTATLMSTIDNSLLGGFSSNADAPGITMTSGDMNGDGKEELAAALSFHNNDDGTYIRNYSKVFIFSCTGSTFTQEHSYNLNLGAEQGILRDASVYMAEVTGDTKKELFIAGRILSPSMSGGNATYDYNPDSAYKQFGTVSISYTETGYRNNTFQAFASYGGSNGTYLSKEQNEYGRYGAPIGLGVANLGAMGTTDKIYAYVDEQLYLINPAGLTLTLVNDSYLTYTEDPYTRSGGDTDKRDRWVSSVTVGNFNGSEDGRQQILVVTGLRAKGNTQRYWYQLSWYSLEGANLIRGNEMIMAHSLSYNNSETDINNSCFVAIAAPDVNDDDSLLLERIGDVQRYYTKPSINAIIQASPYFDDLSSDSYPNEGSTEFGSSTGSTQSGLASCGASAAVKGEVEIELGATIDIETQTTFAFNYDYEYTWANETSVTFGGGTDDYVIMYTTPYSVYSYRMLVSETKKAKVPGSPRYNTYSSYADALLRAQSEPDFYNTSFMPYAAWVELNTDYLKMTPQQIWQNFKPGTRAPKSYFYVEIEEPDNPVTTILTVDQYDEIASRTDGLETIRGTYLNNVPGDPASYANIPTSYHSIHKVGTPRQVGYAEGGYITAEYEVSTEESHEFNFSVEFESSIMVGAGAVGCKAVAGLAGSLSGGGGYAYSDSRGNTYTGTVDSLPKDATDYDFSWQLCKASATINGKEVDIVYYDVKNVRCLPKTPQNLTVSDVSADSVTLTWDNNSSASRFEIYAVNGGGQSLFLDTVIAGASGDTLSYESTGLTAGTTYYYKIRAVNNSGLKSRFSSVVSATTLPDSGGSFGISQQPKDFETFAGDVAIFTVVAYTTNNKPIQYQWQTYDKDAKSWNDIDGKRSATLKVNATPERDGSQYRCIVYQGAGCMVYSSPVELIIGKTGSNTTLTVAKNSPAITIPDGSTVYCAGVKQETITKPLFDWVYDIRTVDENLYTKLAYSESTDTNGDPLYGDPFVFVSNEGKYYSVTAEDEIGEEITPEPGFYNGAENFLLNKDGSTITHTGYYETNVVNEDIDETYDINGTSYTFTKLIAQADYADTDDNASYKVYSFDQASEEGSEEGTIRRIFYKFDCDGGSKWAELNIEESNSYDTVIINQNGTDIKAEEFKAVKVNKQTGTETIVVGETSADGDRLFLKASSTSQTTNEALTFDSYSFVIKNAETGNVVLNNTVTGNRMEYTFTDPGVYEITVSSSGDNNYKASTSEKTIIYVVNDPEIGSEKKLVISGSDIKYGERLDLNPVIIKDSQGAAADNINYTVMYGGNEITGLIEGNTFTPDKAGAYIINAVSNEPESDEPDSKKLAAAASINVSKRDLKVSVLNCEAPCNASETDKLSFISYDVEGDIDNIWADEAVNAVSDAFTATEAGRYPINLDVNTGFPVFEEIDSKYNLKLNGATYTLTSSAYKVTVDTENKGSSDISYIVDGADEPSFASSGDYIASGADVTVTALPNNGYVFKGWMNNGSNVSTNAVYEINSLSEDLNLKAIFEAVEHSKNYTVDYGTLNVGYTSKEINANPTVTGDRVLVKDSDYVITYYEIDENGVITQRCDAPVNIGRYLFVMSTVGDEISSVYGFEGGVPETITGENADEFIETFKCANILTITDSTAGHIHNYTSAVTTEPTCTQTGVKTFTCDCGESYIVDIPALGHSFGDWTNVVSDICGGDSFTERVCTECGFKETANVHAQDHIWASEYTIDRAATCTTDGSKSIHCSKCDATQFSTTIPATGHSYGDWTNVVADTCDGESYSVRTCSVCGAEEEANRHVQGHTWSSEYTIDKAATCTEDGAKSIHCTKCDATQFSTAIPALGHTFGDWEDKISETCGGNSYSERTCSVCGVKETANVHAQDHIWENEYTTDKEATCTTDGSKSIHCSKCDATQFSTSIPALGHSYGDWTNVVADTCDGESYSVRTCSVCEAEEIANRHVQGHTWASEYITDKAATCTEDGSKSIHCTKCDATQFSTAIPALGHSFGEWEDKVSETCGGDSYSVRTCSVCGVTESANLHAQDHIWENEYTVDKEASCTEEGSKSIHCTKCDATQFSTSISALGHSFGEWKDVVSETCGGESYSVRTCSVCETEEIANRHTQDHTWEKEYTVDKEATCTEDGSKSIHCSKCDATQYNDVIPAKGHTAGDWETVTPATETANGKEVRKCTVCGEVVDSREVSASGEIIEHSHSYSYTITTPATCVDDGVFTYTCDCGDSYTAPYYALGHVDKNNDGKCDKCGTVISENSADLDNTVINVPENTTVEWKQTATVIVTAASVPADYEIVLYYRNTRIAQKPDKNGNVTIEHEVGRMLKNTKFTVVAEKNGYTQNNSNGVLKKDFTVNVKTGFFDKIVSFFKRFFCLLKPVVIKPNM